MELQKKIGEKIKKFREKMCMSQRDLAEKLGFQNHQAILHLELGTRELKAAELSKLANIFQIDMNVFFQDEAEKFHPFVLWRNKPKINAQEYEAQFIRVCKDYDLFEELLGSPKTNLPYKLPRFPLNIKKYTIDDAYALAEKVRELMGLGKYPGNVLIKTLEDQFHVRFFSIDLNYNASAACTWINDNPCLLVTTSEPFWRQHFSVAHELFHLITWNDDCFKQIEDNDSLNKKNEQLANAFAAGLLMPAEAVKAEKKNISVDGIGDGGLIALARKFEVSLSACIYRLKNLHIIESQEAKKFLKNPILNELDAISLNEKNRSPYEFHSSFLRLGYLCYESGKISKARFAKALNTSLVDLPIILKYAGFAEVESGNRVEINHT